MRNKCNEWRIKKSECNAPYLTAEFISGHRWRCGTHTRTHRHRHRHRHTLRIAWPIRQVWPAALHPYQQSLTAPKRHGKWGCLWNRSPCPAISTSQSPDNTRREGHTRCRCHLFPCLSRVQLYSDSKGLSSVLQRCTHIQTSVDYSHKTLYKWKAY